MGLSSSQARLLHLTSRMHQIEYKAAKLEAEKLQMANQSRQVYDEYLLALEKTKMQYKMLSTDGAITYTDANYLDLMSGKSGKPFLLYAMGSDKLCLSEELIDIYNSSTNAEDFAVRLANYRSNGSQGDANWWNNQEAVIPGTPTPDRNPVPIIKPNPDNPDNPGGNDKPDIPGGTDKPVSPDNPDPNAPDTPDPDNPDVPGDIDDPKNPDDTPPEDFDYSIQRKSKRTVTIPANQTNKVLCVKDDLLGDRYYTISTGSSSISCEILDNGRLYIKGNNAKIEEKTSQKDDIILFGNGNTVNTGDLDDTVRVGIVSDTDAAAKKTGNGLKQQITYDNVINTGSGNDYIQNFGLNTIDGGSGTDKLNYINNNAFDYIGQSIRYDGMPSSKYVEVVAPKNCEITSGQYNNVPSQTYSTSTNNSLDWAMQGQYGDCQTLSCIYSINNKGKYNEFFDIKQNGSGWTVTFKKSGITQQVSNSDIKDKSVKCDKDWQVLEAAFKKQVEKQGVNLDTGMGLSSNWGLLSNIIYGQNRNYDTYAKLKESEFTYLAQQYMAGNISNLIVGSPQTQNSSAAKVGILTQHAYAVKSVDINKSVTLVNPHDTNDQIVLDWTDFFKYLDTVILVGDTHDKYVEKYGSPSGSGAIYRGENDIILGGNGVSQGDTELYSLIGQAIASGNYELVPGDMILSKTFLTNVVNGGFAYMKTLDDKNNWYDTSVATNTSLQEVEDTSLLKKAEAKYEADMLKIDRKDRKYDYDLAALDAERNAIKQEMDTLKTVAKENVDRTFKLFS